VLKNTLAIIKILINKLSLPIQYIGVVDMSIERVVLAFAGTVILISLVLSQLHSVYWLGLTAFVGVNLLQSSITGFCPLAKILKAIGLHPSVAFR
jgi:hypothetical protein